MSKIILTSISDLTNPTTAATAINANNATIQTAIDNTLSRDGTSPNTMGSDLDMNSHGIINLPTPTSPTSPLRLQDLSGFSAGGIPAGGATGQTLQKTSNLDFVVGWATPSAPSIAVGSITGLGANVATFLATPSSANLASAVTNETGSGALVFATSPTLVTPILGTPASGTLTSCTGLPLAGLNTQAAFTLVGNNTSSAAVPTAVDISTLTTKASPAASDLMMISDQAASGAWKKVTVSSVASAGSVSSIAGNTGAFTLANGIDNSTNQIQLTAARRTLPTTQVFTSGTAATYTTPANCLWIEVECVGGGGGGGPSATLSTSGGTGGNTTFSTITASGGAGAGQTVGGVGGAASGGYLNIPGGAGSGTNGTTGLAGGHGGGSFFGGAGGGSVSANGIIGATNSGSGGGGAGQSTQNSGSGGGAGGYVKKIIISPSATYTYTVGAAGAAGTGSGFSGGAGAAGIITVIEHYGS